MSAGLGACWKGESFVRYATIGYNVSPWKGFTARMGLEFSGQGVSLSFVITGQGIR